MARRTRTPSKSPDWLFPGVAVSDEDEPQSSLLDVMDKVLNKGAVLNGDLILGVANVDLIYAKLSVLLSALDKVSRDPVFKPVAAGPSRARSRSARRKRRRGRR
jgi:hypothetical protein